MVSLWDQTAYFTFVLCLIESTKSWRLLQELSEPALMNFLFSLMSASLVANLTVQKRCEQMTKRMEEKMCGLD